MRNKISTFTLTLLATMLVMVGSAMAEDNSELSAIIKPSSVLSFGVGSWSDDRQKLGMNDGMHDKRQYLLLDADINIRDDATATWKNLMIRNLGLDTREISAEYLEQGKQGIKLEYSQFKHYVPYTINTNQIGIGSSTQTTGTNIPNTAIGSGSNYQFGVDRNKFGMDVYKNLIPDVDLRINFTNEQKEGNRITSNGSALFLADPIAWVTNQLEAILSYNGERLQLQGGYNSSWFQNKNSTPYVSLGTTLMTQPLNNQANQAFVNGAYRFTPTTTGNFKISYTNATQNDTLPTSGISSNIYGDVPRLQGEVNTALVQLGLAAKPITKLGLVANLRFNDAHDNTPQYGVVRSTDNSTNITLNTTPLSYTTTNGKLEANYDLTRGYNVIAGIDYSKQARTTYTAINGVTYNTYVPFRADLNEATYRLQLGKHMSEALNGSLAYLYAERGGSDMTTSTRIGTDFVSPLHIADRKRQKVRLALDWTASEKIEFQLNLESAADQYGTRERGQGIHDGNADLYAIDMNYQISETWQANAWYSYNMVGTHLVSYTSASNQKLGQQVDTSNAVGLNITGSVNNKIKVGADISHSKDKSNFDQSSSDGTALAGVPEITSELTRVKIFANYAVKKNADLRLEFSHEVWKTDDWQWMYSSGQPWQFGTTTDGTTVLTDPKQNFSWFSIRYSYTFQ